jgi:RNA polymerase sigma factor (sigma-70 family)
MSMEDHELLRRFSREQSQDAFTELVNRRLNLVYSAALRQVRSPQLAEEVSQTVFTNLARHAAKIAPDTVLTAWLYQVTRHAAVDVIRREASRQAREQIAFQMSELQDPSADWSHIEPLLDEAMDSLDATDRTALLLRYFDNKSLRGVGEALGVSEDAAQKRVTRAVERLREHFSKHKINAGTAAIVGLLSANAIQAAPAGLALSVATTAVTGLTALSTTTAITKTIALTMTATQKLTVTAFIAAGAIGIAIYEGFQVNDLRGQIEVLHRQQQDQAALNNQVQELQAQHDRAKKQVAALLAENAARRPVTNETFQLRGEVSQLRREKKELGSTSGLSKVTANPEARKMMREQQKMGMSAIYQGFALDVKLTEPQTQKLNDLLADHIMDNVENVTIGLREKMGPNQLTQMFGAQEADLNAKIRELVGDEAFEKYQDYSMNLVSTISAKQFQSMMTGDKVAKEEKAKQMLQILKEESQAVLAGAGLPADYQLVPMLNFRNIASESEGEKGLALLDSLYTRATPRLETVLTKEDQAKFQEFRAKALENTRAAFVMNRTLMAPIGN